MTKKAKERRPNIQPAGTGVLTVVMLSASLLFMSSCSKSEQRGKVEKAAVETKVQAVMRYAPPNSAGVVHVKLAEFRKEFIDAVAKLEHITKDALNKKGIAVLNQIDTLSNFLVKRDNKWETMFVVRITATSPEMLQGLVELWACCHQKSESKLIKQRNGRYKLIAKSSIFSSDCDDVLLPRVKDTEYRLIFGVEADDVDDKIIIIGPGEMMTEKSIAGLGKGNNAAIDEMLRNVDTSMQTWCALDFKDFPVPKIPRRFFGSLNMTSCGGGLTLQYSDEDNAKGVMKALGDVWTLSAAMLGKPAIVKRSGTELTVTLEEGKTGLDYLLISMARAKKMAEQIVSKMNLLSIGKFLEMYESDFNGEPPPSLKRLVQVYDCGYNVLSSPVSGRTLKTDEKGVPTEPGDYVYIVLPKNAPADLVRAYEKPEYYNGRGTLVLFKDGKVKWMDMKDFRKAPKRTQQWLDERKKGSI